MLRTERRHCHGPLRLHSLLLCLPALIGAVEPGLAWSSTEFAPSQGVPQALQPTLCACCSPCVIARLAVGTPCRLGPTLTSKPEGAYGRHMWESTINFESWQSEAVVWLDFGPELQNKERGPVLQDMLLESVSISEGLSLIHI